MVTVISGTGFATHTSEGKAEGRSKVQKYSQGEGKSPQTTTPSEMKDHRYLATLPAPNQERLRIAKTLVDHAVKMHKIFSIQGPYPVLRAALRARGWIERHTHWPNQPAPPHHSDVGRAGSNDADADNSDDVKTEQDSDGLHDYMSHLVRNEMVYLFWTLHKNAIDTSSLHKEQTANHFAKAGTGSITTKVGLCVSLRSLRWLDSTDPHTFFPRCYVIREQEEKHAFIEDYRRTACTSLLRYIVERETGGQGGGTNHNVQDQWKRSKPRRRPLVISQMIASALKVCQNFLESLEHRSLETPQTPTEEEWAEFINSYCLVVHDGAEIEDSAHFVASCKAMLRRLSEVCPQLDIDGTHNIWIIKPGAMSRGRGIRCTKRLDQILMLVDGDPDIMNRNMWVVQKYLEHPLLVHDTKFDVRQWFLVTNWRPLTVWFYQKCYMRFSTQPYSLDTLDNSVHLCNYSTQKHLRPSEQRHQGIPADNVWSDDQFKSFLSSQGLEGQWQTVVVPGMKRALVHTMKTARNLRESHKNSFELYGADFMIGHDLRPWLIEVNASPTMDPSTPVTAQLCAAVQEDTLRVVLDHRADRAANTGDFQLIYQRVLKNTCPPPPLRSPNCSAPKHQGPVKEKGTATNEIKHQPRQPKNTSSGLPPPPLLPRKASILCLLKSPYLTSH